MTDGMNSTPIRYVIGDATSPICPPGQSGVIIAHIVNNRGGWGRGFVVAVSRKWPASQLAYRSWHADRFIGSGFGLGAVQLVRVEPTIWVANMVAQDGIGPGPGERPPIRYDSLRLCLRELAIQAKKIGANVHMPRIGTGLGGGDWSKVQAIIEEELVGVKVTVYDLPRRT